jgi:O-antigen/teichoic acid export membrane protein
MSARRTLLTNIFSLSGIQVVNYALPVLTVPYIVRVIGPDYYGLVNFAQAFALYFVIIVNYGFDLSATREVSLYRDNKEKLSVIFSSVIITKVILFIITLLIFTPLVFLIPKFKDSFIIFLFAYLIVIGNVALPVWLFQGLEKLARLALFNLIIKLSYAICIFLMITKESDYILIPLVLSLSQIMVGVVAFLYSVKVIRISFIFPEIEEVKKAFKSGWNLFLSFISMNLYTTSNIVILGLFCSNSNVGYFSASTKVIGVIQSLVLLPINQSFFPRLSNILSNSRHEGIGLLKKLTFVIGVTMFFISILLFSFSDLIIKVVFGSKFLEASYSLRIMAIIPFFIGLSNIFGIQGIINLKMDKQFLVSTLIGALISILLNLLLVPIYFEIGTAISWLITEVFICISFLITLLRSDINPFDWRFLKSLNFRNKM